DPLRIGRPGQVVTLVGESAVDILLANRGELATGRIEHPEVEAVVVKNDTFGIGRPLRIEVVGGLFGEFEFLDGAAARLGASKLGYYVEPIEAGLVGEIGDRLPVRRPCGLALHHAGGIGDVARGAMLGSHGEDFTVGFESRAQTSGRNGCVVDLFANAVDLGADLGQVGVDFDRHHAAG